MLVELPAADQIDALAITAPTFEVRKYEFDLADRKADLKYPPCKGQVVLVMVGERGLLLSRGKGDERWGLPSGRIGACEDPETAAKRVAKETTGLGVSSVELAGMYDVTWHYSDVSIKRLHIVYAARVEDELTEDRAMGSSEVRFFTDLSGVDVSDDIVRDAILDCSEK
jgi:ADP-ribose pyrophosphatase YjhB (NUDIX family)